MWAPFERPTQPSLRASLRPIQQQVPFERRPSPPASLHPVPVPVPVRVRRRRPSRPLRRQTARTRRGPAASLATARASARRDSQAGSSMLARRRSLLRCWPRCRAGAGAGKGTAPPWCTAPSGRTRTPPSRAAPCPPIRRCLKWRARQRACSRSHPGPLPGPVFIALSSFGFLVNVNRKTKGVSFWGVKGRGGFRVGFFVLLVVGWGLLTPFYSSSLLSSSSSSSPDSALAAASRAFSSSARRLVSSSWKALRAACSAARVLPVVSS